MTEPAADEVLQAAALLEALFGQSPVGIAVLDTELRYVRVNPTLERLNGVPAVQAIGHTPAEVLPAEGARQVEEQLRAVLATGEPRPLVEIRGRRGASTERTYLASYYRLQAPDGRVLGAASIVLEVTAERAAEKRAREAVERLDLLQRITSRLSEAHELVDVGNAVVHETAAALGASSAVLVCLSPDGEHLEVLAHLGMDERTREQYASFPLDAALPASDVTRSGRPMFWRSAAERNAAYPVFASFTDRVQGYALIPLVVGERPLGAVGFGFATEREFTVADREVMNAVGRQCALALDRWQLLSAERAARTAAESNRDRLEVLADAARVLGGSLDYEATLRQVAQVLLPRLADSVSVHLLDDRGLRVVALSHVDPARERLMHEIVQAEDRYTRSPVLVQAAREGRTLFSPDVPRGAVEQDAVDPEHRAQLAALDVCSGIVVPLVGSSDVFGILSLTMSVSGRHYTDADLRTVQELADRAGLAIENAMAHRTSTELAVTLQRSLLPEALPSVPGLAATFRYAPGTSGTEVGGDWVDVIALPAGRAALVIGDVMGRGVRAAAVMGQLRAAVRAYAAVELAPEQVLGHLDTLVSGLGDQIVTCLYGVYDPADHTLVVASAGHPPPVLYEHASGSSALLSLSTAPPLGAGHSGHLSHTLRLAVGDVLVCYTDGLVENRARDVDTGAGQLRDLVPRLAGDLEGLCDRALAELSPAAGYEDDVALLALQVTAVGEPATAELALPPEAHSVHEARQFVEETLRSWNREALAEEACLCVSELVTNAVRHAGTSVLVQVRAVAGGVVLEVADGDFRLPKPRRAGPMDETGRGLMLVEMFSNRWGSRPTANGKVVWAELHPHDFEV